MDHEIHPAANLFPMMADDELVGLSKSIEANGLLTTIKLYENKIIDGRNRARACELAGVEPRYELAMFGGNPYEWVWATNAERRHLTPDQRAMIRAVVAERSGEWARLQAEAKAEADRVRAEQQTGRPRRRVGKGNDGPSQNGDTRSAKPAKKRSGATKVAEKVAAEINVDAKKVEAAHRLAVEAPALAEQVARGEKKLCEATAEAFPKPKAPPPAPPPSAPEPEATEASDAPLVVEVVFHGETARRIRELAEAAGASADEWAWNTIRELVGE